MGRSTRSPTSADATCRAASIPTVRDLPARGSVELTVHVPRTLWRLTPHAGRDPEVAVDDLSAVATAIVHVGVSDGPFYHVPAGPPLRAQLATWLHVRSASWRDQPVT
jgi:hypothetical protein